MLKALRDSASVLNKYSSACIGVLLKFRALNRHLDHVVLPGGGAT